MIPNKQMLFALFFYAADKTGSCSLSAGYCPVFGSLGQSAVNVGQGNQTGSQSTDINADGGFNPPESDQGAVFPPEGVLI
jgi:hypothetical protein